jgi:predicted Zn finger-like uncharacterized protein
MNCSCPKCSANIDIDLLLVPDNGKYIKCSECKRRFWVSREFFAGRALRKRGEIFCAECGEGLDHTIACPSCRALFPDFFAVQAKKPVPRKLPEIKLSFASAKVHSSKPRYKSSRAISPKPGIKMTKSLMVTVSVTALVALVIYGGYFYYQRSLETEYSRNFVRALYAIKTGRDINHETAEKIVSKLNASGQKYGLLISDQDEARLNKVKSSADKLMKRINDPPKKYIKANEKLVKLYNIYSELNSFMISPPSSLDTFKISSNKLENDFDEGVRDMKANLPQKLSERIKTAQVRYKNLRDI